MDYSNDGKTFLCTGYASNGQVDPNSLVCEVVESYKVNSHKRNTKHSDSSSSSSSSNNNNNNNQRRNNNNNNNNNQRGNNNNNNQRGNNNNRKQVDQVVKTCRTKIGRQIFSACINQGNITSNIVQNLVSQANNFISQSGSQFASSICTQQDCDCQSCEKRCEVFDWSYTINQKGIQCDSTCPSQQRYVVEAVVVAQCRCAKRECGLNKFDKPIVLESTQCVMSDTVFGNNDALENTCNSSVQNLLNTAQSLGETFCNKSLCSQNNGNNSCHFSKLHHSEVECKKVKMPNGMTCCHCKIKIYGIDCSCNTNLQ
jgi:hypothetical protein